MGCRNVDVRSVRHRRIRAVQLERMEVIEPLFEKMEANRAGHNALIAQMHDLYRRSTNTSTGQANCRSDRQRATVLQPRRADAHQLARRLQHGASNTDKAELHQLWSRSGTGD